MKNLLFATSMIVLTTACVTNVEDQVPPEITGSVSYSEKIQPIFNNSCGGSACHTNGGNANNVNLASYQTAINSIGQQYGSLVIVPDSSDISPLSDKLNSNPEFGSKMPIGRSISAQEIAEIRTWIDQGAQNN